MGVGEVDVVEGASWFGWDEGVSCSILVIRVGWVVSM